LKVGVVELGYSATTDSSGFFTVTVPSPGTYGWRVKNPQTLANSGSVVLVSSPTQQEMGLLRVGDATNDNCVTINDSNVVHSTYAKALGQPGYDARADFNGDDIVSIVDFNLMRNNFGTCGAMPILPR